MSKPSIGIRQADGSFYSIMADASDARKRLVLSAARADQNSVKIDLYRSTDGSVEGADLVGSLDLIGAESLEFQDIEFLVQLDGDKLSATASLPGGASSSLDVDLAEFRTQKRSDSDILSDESFDEADLDTLDDAFGDLGDETDDNVTLDLPEAPEARAKAEPAFDLDDLDAGFGSVEPEDELETLADEALPEAEAEGEDDAWHDFSMDDMEPMEFLDTGDQISAPKAKAKAAPPPDDDFSMDDDSPVELGLDDVEDADEALDLPDFDEPLPEYGSSTDFDADLPGPGSSGESNFDDDFLPPPSLAQDPEFAAPAPEKKKKAPKAEKPARGTGGTIDKTALVLSLVFMSLLVITLVVLLFLNMIRPPQTPVIQPEVKAWQGGPALAQAEAQAVAGDLDLGAATLPTFASNSLLAVPAALKGARVTLRLAEGDTVADASRRFGPPDRVEGDQLSW